MKRSHLIVCALLVVLCEAATMLLYSQLSEPVATHWNASGVVDGYSPRWTLFFGIPGLMLGMIALFHALPWLSPRRFEVGSFAPTSSYLMVLVVGFLAYIHFVILWKGIGRELDISRAVLGAISLLILATGNVLGKLRRNFFIGIRTPWTLASERVWYGTHRLAAKAFVAAGLVGLVLAYAHVSLWAWLAVLAVAILVPLVYSLTLYKRLERTGQLGEAA
jgi:uncharacterized membrane protein